MATLLFPDNFLSSLNSAAGFRYKEFIHAHAATIPVSVRLHPQKNKCGFTLADNVPWCSNAYYLQERPVFTLDPFLHAGCYYVQEASSMFTGYAIQQVCDVSKPIKVLDLCAAPGGKSTHIASVITPQSLIVCNEIIHQRVQVLKENITKWGYANTLVTHSNPARFKMLPEYFDVIIVDAPCSGSGLFRKDAEAMQHWSKENVMMCAHRQQKIIDDILPALKEYGILIYSTCSYSTEEDEEITDYLISQHQMEAVKVPVPAEWNIVETKTTKDGIGYRFYPDRIQGEGFYLSVLRKTKHINIPFTKNSSKISMQHLSNDAMTIVSHWVKDMHVCDFFTIQNTIICVPKGQLSEMEKLTSSLNIIQAGIKAGEIKGNDFIPAHALAMSALYSPTIPVISIDMETALQYLRKQTIQIPGNEAGWALVSYQEKILGWIKKIPGRINNYYPAEYRIRM